jgi:uncharacterized protein
MEFTPAEARVLACLIEKQVDGPAAYALTLDELRFACNQAEGPRRVEPFDDRVLIDTLLSLKSKGLASFLPTGRTAGEVRYRHRADERWRLNVQEQAVLAALVLRGPQTPSQVLSGVPAGSLLGTPTEVEAVLDALAGRTPAAFAVRTSKKGRGGETLWAEILTGSADSVEQLELGEMGEDRAEGLGPGERAGPPAGSMQSVTTGTAAGPSPLTLAELADRLSGIERRLASIETELGILRQLAEDQGAPDRPPSRLRT